MKGMIYFSLLFLLPLTTLFGADIIGLDGVYTNPYTYSEIQVDSDRYGIKVRGLDYRNPRKWAKFKRVDRYTFADNNGNQVKIKGQNRFGEPRLLIKPRHGKVEVFLKNTAHNHHRHGSTSVTIINYDDDWNDYNDYGYYDERRPSDRGSYSSNNNRDNNYYNNDRYTDKNPQQGSHGIKLAGTYKANDGRLIALVETRDGFKAKFKGERSWKDYQRRGDRFEDADGNFYTIGGDKELYWKGKYSGKAIVISKIDDKVQF